MDGDLVPFDEVSVFTPTMGAFLAARKGGIGVRAVFAIRRRFGDDDRELAPIQVLGTVLAGPFPHVFQITRDDPGDLSKFNDDAFHGGDLLLLRESVDFFNDVECDSELVH